MAGKYATGTVVTVERSKAEIEATVKRYGATAFMSGSDLTRAFIMFEIADRRVRFVVAVPAPADPMFARNARRQATSTQQRQQMAAAEERRLWRCLLLSIKSKLEVVESGIESLEESFMAHIVLPNQTTVGDWLQPQIAEAYETGGMPTSMLALPSGA